MSKIDKPNQKSQEELIQEILFLKKEIKAKKKYGLVWDEEKIPEKVVTDCQENLPVLSEVKKNEIITNEKEPIHILIEGDNFHSLSVLNYTHRNSIDLIYIDPPYNTGNKDFIYNDTYVEKEDNYRHSKWLSFMNKRLDLARDLLKPDGCIFISINEEEQAHLKLICDKVFGSENYLTMFSVKVRHENRILKGDKDFHEVIEYLYMYKKSSRFKTTKRIEDNTSIDAYKFEIIEKIDNPQQIKLGSKMVEVFKPSEYEQIEGEPANHKLKKINIRGTIKEGNANGRFFMKYLNEFIGKKNGYLYKVPNMGDDMYDYRYFLIPEPKGKKIRTNGDYFQGVPQNKSDTKEVPYANFLDYVDEFNSVGYEGGVTFRNGKKPIAFLMKIFELGGLIGKTNATVLDFFGGSGSSAHALLQFNKDYHGHRKMILCTNNENNICEEITFPRITNAIKGYSSRNEMFDPLGNNLKYFKTSFVKNNRNRDQLKIDITKKCTEMLCLKEGVFKLKKKADDWKIFEQGQKFLGIYYDLMGDSLDDLKNEMNKINGDKTLYCFTIDPSGLDDYDFNDWKNIKLEPIPQKILEVYKRIFQFDKK